MYVTKQENRSRVIKVEVEDVISALIERLGLEIVITEVPLSYRIEPLVIISLKKGGTWRRLRFILGW